MHELKKLEIREDRQQLNEFVFLAAVPWLVGAGMSAYDYFKLKDQNQGKSNPMDWDKSSQAEFGAGLAGTLAGGAVGGILGKLAGKIVGPLAGLVAKGSTKAAGAAVKAASKATAKRAAKKATTKIGANIAKTGRQVGAPKTGIMATPKPTAALAKLKAAGGKLKVAGQAAGPAMKTGYKVGKELGKVGGRVAGAIAGRGIGQSAGRDIAAGGYGKGKPGAAPVAKKKAPKGVGGYYADNPDLLK